MSSSRLWVSDTRSLHKLLSSDNLITDRAILSELKNNAFLLVKRESNLRKLWSTDTIFTTIPCLEMIEVPITECCEFADECTISRTKYKLPRIAEGNYQYLIQGVYSINVLGGKGKKLKEVTINRYLNLLKLPIIKNEIYYWIVNEYLYTNNPLLKSLRISAMFEESIPKEIMCPDCECGSQPCSDDEYCKNPLDEEFPCPNYLKSQVLKMTSDKLLSVYYKLKTDYTSDNVDAQSPNSTEQAK